MNAWILAIVLLGQAAASGDVSLEKQVATLIAQFDAGSKADRDAAERQLLDLGPKAISALPASDEVTNTEARLRLARVRNTLEKRLAESATHASRVSIVGENLPLAEVLASIEHQTGNRLIDYREDFHQEARDIRLTLDLNDVEFWPALDQILDQAELTTYGWGDSRTMRIVARPDDARRRSGRAQYCGVFRIAVRAIVATRELETTRGDRLQISMLVEWEPRVQPLEVTLLSADGTNEGHFVIAVDSSRAAAAGALMFRPLPPRELRRLDVLSGTLNISMLAATADFRFPRVAGPNGRHEQIGSAQVTLENWRVDDGTCSVTVRTKFANPGQALESHRGWIYQNPAWLELPTGDRIAAVKSEPALQKSDMVRFNYTFPVPINIDDYTFVYRTPTAILKTTVPFEFKDLPLP